MQILISRTQTENFIRLRCGKMWYLNEACPYSYKSHDGNQARFGILGGTNRNEIEKNVRHYYGKKGIEKSKTGEISRLGFHKGQSHGYFVMQTIMQ